MPSPTTKSGHGEAVRAMRPPATMIAALAIAHVPTEEVTLKGGYQRRPDTVLYVNGIALRHHLIRPDQRYRQKD